MPNTRRTYVKGRMNLDVDSRLLEEGEYREAENIEVINSEGSDVGAIENPLSNRKLTNLDLGNNVIELGKFEDEAQDKLYWFTKSDSGCFLLEWDERNQIASIVLKDTRTEDVDRVLNLKEDKLITGIVKIISEDSKNDLLIWTDDNIEICCINIERAKAWESDGFVKEDIYLIKKPPRYAPEATPTYTNDGSNNLDDKFPAFFYRYKYRDGEYSALSDPTNYKFTPKPFDLDFFTLENKGMINAFNAVNVKFDTGERQVTDIEVCVKFSNSVNIYVIETFNKKNKGLADNDTYSHVFSNSKLYSVLPEKELYRSFDNIPPKAKALTSLENILNISNYEEGMDVVDAKGVDIDVDYSVSLVNTSIENTLDFASTIATNTATFENTTNAQLEIGKQLYFNIDITLDNIPVYSNSFIFLIETDYSSLNALVGSTEFVNFVEIIKNDYQANYNNSGAYDVDPGYALDTETELQFSIISDVPTFTVTPVQYTDANNGNALVVVDTAFEDSTYVGLQDTNNATSCKTNMGYEVGLEYQDEFNRRIPILTTESNTLFIPQQFSIFKNTLKVHINSEAPAGADRYKICVKAKPLQYETIYVNEYYNEDNFVWAKLVAENKDKVNIGDELIIKKAGAQVVTQPIKVKVLDIQTKTKDFIENNTDANENDIIESEGVYMKIRPNGFSMDFDDFRIYQNEVGDVRAGNDRRPVNYLGLFTNFDNTNISPLSELPINQGSSIYLFLNSSRNYTFGWRNMRFEKTYFAQRNYDTLEEWFEEVITNGNSIPATELETEDVTEYNDNIELVRGFVATILGTPVFSADPNGELFLKFTGHYEGSASRSGYCRAKIVIRNSTGFYAFETDPKQAESEIFYQTEQCFDIVDGNHLGNTQDQELGSFTPAIIDLDFFNCYSQGNGVESYKYKDGFNTNYLNIDLRPSTTSIERPKRIRRFADIIYGQPFSESTGYNGLNEFNASTGNFKELDKQYGSVQRLFARDTDLLVWQEEKVSKVLFGKDLITLANGGAIVSTTPEILGQQVPFAGENGIGLNPESLAWDMYRFYYTNGRRGTPMRLSNDGTSEINYGTIAHFRKLFIDNPSSLKVGGFDPYHKKYVLAPIDETSDVFESFCGHVLSKTLSEPFTYTFNLNLLTGDIVLKYNVSIGNVTIEAVYDGTAHVVSNVNGDGNITIPRTDADKNTVSVTITPIGEDEATLEVTNVCPVGIPLDLFTIILNDKEDVGTTIVNRFKHGDSPFYLESELFESFDINQFKKETGIEGSGKFPNRNTALCIQSFKESTSTGKFDATNGNRLGYLVSENDYTEADIDTILSAATFLTVSESQLGLNSLINQGQFIFNRATDTSKLYLIWDYRNTDTPSVNAGKDITITLPVNSASTTATESYAASTVSLITWTQIGNTPSLATITDGNTLTPTFSNLIEGTYAFNVLVDYADGASANDTLLVIVNGAGLSFDGVVEVDDCDDTDGQNTLVDIEGSNVGDAVTLQGASTAFQGANNWYRLTSGGSTQFYNDISGLIQSSYLVRIDNLGIITNKLNC